MIILFFMTVPIRFVIFGNDEPLMSQYVGKGEVGPSLLNPQSKQESNPHLSEFIMYSSLDAIDILRKTTNDE